MSSFPFVAFGLVCLSKSSLGVDSVVLLSVVDPKNFFGCDSFFTNFAIDFRLSLVVVSLEAF